VLTPQQRRLAAGRAIERLCSGGLGVADLQRAVLRELRALLPVDAAFFATADPDTLLFTGAWSEEPLAAATAAFLDNELAGGDVNRFTDLATSGRPVASLDAVTRGDRAASPRYRDIMRPLGLGDELRAALLSGPHCWGYLCLHREDAEHGFTGAELTLVARLGPHLADALRRAALLGAGPPPGSGPGPGVVVLGEDLDLVAMTPEAEELLSLVAQPAGAPAGLPLAVRGVAATLCAAEAGIPTSPAPRARVPLVTGGWLDVHASRLAGPGGAAGITVVVAPASPHGTVPLLLAAHGLTRREAEVARLVLRGASTRAIADTLHISHHTVQDHLKAVFDKTGVRSRRDLVGRLLAQGAAAGGPAS
jgi:DNA-binding CsgD family transcriptional regulator